MFSMKSSNQQRLAGSEIPFVAHCCVYGGACPPAPGTNLVLQALTDAGKGSSTFMTGTTGEFVRVRPDLFRVKINTWVGLRRGPTLGVSEPTRNVTVNRRVSGPFHPEFVQRVQLNMAGN